MASAEAFTMVKIWRRLPVWLGLKAWRSARSFADHTNDWLRQALREGSSSKLEPEDSASSRIHSAVCRCFAARSSSVCRPRRYLSCAEHNRRYCGDLRGSNSSCGS